MINQYPGWKYGLIALVVFLGVVYALPNIYGKSPTVVIKSRLKTEITSTFQSEVKNILKAKDIKYHNMEVLGKRLYISFSDTTSQFKAVAALEQKFIEDYIIAQTLVPTTPQWMRSLNAKPMYLGLDLQGGVHALMDVDLAVAIKKTVTRYHRELRKSFIKKKMRNRGVSKIKAGIRIKFKKLENRVKISNYLGQRYKVFKLTESESDGFYFLKAELTEKEIAVEKELAMEKNIQTLRRRVDELGVDEPVIIRQGKTRIVIQLPGIQDPAKLWQVIGKQAILESRPLSPDNDAYINGGYKRGDPPPPGTEVLKHREVEMKTRPVTTTIDGRTTTVLKKVKVIRVRTYLVSKEVTWSGEHVKNAIAGFSTGDGPSSSAVHITLDDEGGKRNQAYASRNLNKRSAIVFIETVPSFITVDGKQKRINKIKKSIVNVAYIRSATLFKRFEISGLDDPEEARILALFLRSGALAAPMIPVEVRTIGPSAGADNVRQGFYSVIIGFVLVLILMFFYYRQFGAIANVALVMNLVLLVALLSMLQATLTLPGIAGIVLTVGMAVDANVLIFERIREEIRLGNSPQASIHSGYDKAFVTIFDANITTLIAALVLLGIGSGPVRGFAVTLSLGILTSMFTAIMGTRAIVNLVYGGKKIEKISI